jgi:hypothetical protein
MAAPKGNQFWKLRASHGRHLIFSSPEILWDAAKEYFEATDKRKWYKTDFKGKDNEQVLIPTDTPYTLTGLFIFLDTNKQTWSDYRQREDFIDVITRIEQIMYTQKFEGAAVGAFTPNIIARDLGLKDSSDITTNGNDISTLILPDAMKKD